jgi:hypothetical protein
LARAAQPLPQPPQPAIEHQQGVHLHLHGISAEDVAALLRSQDGHPATVENINKTANV